MKKSQFLLVAVAGMLAALADIKPEMSDRLAETSVQKLNSARADLESAVTDYANSAEGEADLVGEPQLPPFVIDLLAEARAAFAARDARDVQAVELATRNATALETIADLLAAHLPAAA